MLLLHDLKSRRKKSWFISLSLECAFAVMMHVDALRSCTKNIVNFGIKLFSFHMTEMDKSTEREREGHTNINIFYCVFRAKPKNWISRKWFIEDISILPHFYLLILETVPFVWNVLHILASRMASFLPWANNFCHRLSWFRCIKITINENFQHSILLVVGEINEEQENWMHI